MTELLWRKAKDCNYGQCVEVAALPEGVAVRDSKDPDGPIRAYDRQAFREFVAGVRRGDFDDLLEPPSGPLSMNTSAPPVVVDPGTWLYVERL